MTEVDEHVTSALHRAALRARLAPSIHNTQPWRFVLARDALEIRADASRRLQVLDPRGRQLMISCGCALFNARAALAAAGCDAVVHRFPDGLHGDLVARLTVPGASREWVPIGDLDESVELRRTNRRRFADDPVPLAVVQDLIAAAKAEGAELFVIDSREHRAATARLSQQADQFENSDPAYRSELEAWTSDDPRRLDGVLAGSVPYAAHDESHDPLPIRDFDTREMGWLPSHPHSDADQCLLLLGTLSDGPVAWLQAGEALQRVWLELTRLGYAASPLTQMIEVAETHARLREELHLAMHPDVLLRVGRAPETIETRRRRVEDVISESK